MQRNVEQGREKGLHAGLSESLSRKGLSPVAPLLAFIIKENSAAKKKKIKNRARKKALQKLTQQHEHGHGHGGRKMEPSRRGWLGYFHTFPCNFPPITLPPRIKFFFWRLGVIVSLSLLSWEMHEYQIRLRSVNFKAPEPNSLCLLSIFPECTWCEFRSDCV